MTTTTQDAAANLASKLAQEIADCRTSHLEVALLSSQNCDNPPLCLRAAITAFCVLFGCDSAISIMAEKDEMPGTNAVNFMSVGLRFLLRSSEDTIRNFDPVQFVASDTSRWKAARTFLIGGGGGGSGDITLIIEKVKAVAGDKVALIPRWCVAVVQMCEAMDAAKGADNNVTVEDKRNNQTRPKNQRIFDHDGKRLFLGSGLQSSIF